MHGLIHTSLAIAVLAGSPVLAIDGPEVIGKVQKQFDKLRTLSARFEKRHFWKLVDQTQSVKGELHVAKPNRFRLESRIRTVVTDGKTAWSFDPQSEQVLVNDYVAVEDDRSYEKLLFDLVLLGGMKTVSHPHMRMRRRCGGGAVTSSTCAQMSKMLT